VEGPIENAFDLPIGEPGFLSHLLNILAQRADSPLALLYNLKQEAELSSYFDMALLQDGFCFRALYRARAIATAIIGDDGELNVSELEKILNNLKSAGYLFYQAGMSDGAITEHMSAFLQNLKEDVALVKTFKRFQRPLCHRWAERLVSDTLGLHSHHSLTDTHIRRAVLCACLCPLRQNVGSCFATAPAILIQKEQVQLLIEDLYQLLTTGKLKRIFGGVEYVVPLSPSTGIGDLRRSFRALDPRARPEYSPGLVRAFEALELLPRELVYAEKASLLKNWIEDSKAINAEELIHTQLLGHMGLSEEDLLQAHRIEKMQLKGHQYHPGATSKKLETVERFRQLELGARSAFKGVCDNALLKAWEFTLASFSEVKMEFSRWNLYISLGFAHEESGGIGELLYRMIDERIQAINAKIEHYQKDYELAYDQVRATEVLLRQAASEADARRLQAEHQSRAYHMRSCQEVRDQHYSEGSHYSTLYNFLSKQYDAKFPDYFQEIFDAEMHDVRGELYNDSPAGFRLVYKHGRPDPSLWTFIYTPEDYIEVLIDFFVSTEAAVAAELEWEEGRSEILHITSAIVSHLRTGRFIESALQRMAKAHRAAPVHAPLKALHTIEKKPWAYISGGTVTTLLKTYFCRESEFSMEAKWVENESELLIFLLDALKSLPPMATDPYLKQPDKAMIATSPTHAFLLLPGLSAFCNGWQEEGFTYTWVRDQVFLPSQKFYADMRLKLPEQAFLLDEFCEDLIPTLAHSLRQRTALHDKPMTVSAWRQQLYETMLPLTASTHPEQKRSLADRIDAFLYQALPVVPGREWKMLARRLLSDIASDDIEDVLRLFPDVPNTFLTPKRLRELTSSAVLLSRRSPFLPYDLHMYLARHARFVGLAPPSTLLVADTNWPGNYFGFVVNPGTSRLELWRLDRAGISGTPMSSWKPWLSGLDRSPWSLYTRYHEYTFGKKFL